MPYKDLDERKAYHKEYHRQWYLDNKEKRTAEIKAYAGTKGEDWRKSIGRKHHLRTRYNITPSEYEAKAISQDYRCAICSKDVAENIRGGKVVALSVDHNHETGAIRSLLCFKCNSALGLFRDCPEVLIKASQYLESHKPS